MHMSLLPIVLVLVLGGLCLGVWSVVGLLRNASAHQPIQLSRVISLAGASAFFCLLWCLFFIVGAGLSHSAHPFRDTWPQCAAGLGIFVVLPAFLIVWAWRRGNAASPQPKSSFS